MHFTRADFLRRMGWTDCASSYRQLHEAFLRLSSMMIEARNAFYHPCSGHYIDGAFHLIDNFMIGGEGPGRKSQEQLEKPLTFFVCNKMVHESFIAGNIRSLDLNFALSQRARKSKRHAEPEGVAVDRREDLAARLIGVGVAVTVARELCQNFAPEQIELQPECLADREPKNPAAALVKSIRQNWNPPLAFEKRTTLAAELSGSAQPTPSVERASLRHEQAEIKARAREQAAQRDAQQEAEAARLDAIWNELDVPTREIIEAQARACLGVLGLAGRAPAALSAIRRNLLREREA